jgi:protein transport protein SEC23
MLGLNPSTARPAAAGPSMPGQRGGFQTAASRFLMPVQACEFQLTQIIEGLTRDPWPVANDRRPMRCTGVAMNVAVSMLEVSRLDLVSNKLSAELDKLGTLVRLS